MMLETGVELNHTTIHRWVHAYAPELEKRVRRGFLLCARRDATAVKRFCCKTLSATHTSN